VGHASKVDGELLSVAFRSRPSASTIERPSIESMVTLGGWMCVIAVHDNRPPYGFANCLVVI